MKSHIDSACKANHLNFAEAQEVHYMISLNHAAMQQPALASPP